LPENNQKVALFIDFDNIRIGIRQHFGGELHPQKLMSKASKYGRVTTAKAYADFTGHPKEFQDRLLFAAGIEPIHAPSKISGGRRQSSADMHMVIDMFLEAIDHPDTDTFVLMTGDADFVRMVATLRRRFGRKVIISGVQSTSTSLDLMAAADARDPITKQDCDMSGELGRLTRPLVTRADLDAQAAAEQAGEQPRKGFLSGIFGRRPRDTQPVAPAPAELPPPAPPAPRRLRATELRPPRPSTRSAAPARTPSAEGGRRGAQRELPPIAPDAYPDEVEQKIVKEIFMMPPGRSGYTTTKTIEETLRSKAGELGTTRKEVPVRLQRLEQMGLFKRVNRTRGAGLVETGELAFDNPKVASLTSGMRRPEATPRPLREPRARRAASEATPEVEPTSSVEATHEAAEAMAEPATVEAAPIEAAPVEAAPVEEAESQAGASEPKPAEPFRWVAGGPGGGDGAAEPPGAAAEATRVARKPRAKSTRKSSAKPRTTRSRARTEEAASTEEPAPAETPASAEEAPAVANPEL